MPNPKRKLGDVGEKVARDYLKEQGYQILEQNYQKPWGEIDLVVQKDKELIFIEVKTRTVQSKQLSKYAYPEENVGLSKKQKLIRTAQTYLVEKNHPPETPWQIDVIALELNVQTRKANLKHFKNVVWQ